MKQDNKDFSATQLNATGENLADVVEFGGAMAVCAAHLDGPVLITKDQAIEFFGLKEPIQ